ncbi:MAG TPA: hypothetical protein VN282_04650 [Pyrinomonadaceae bacterium]|nr:hypothetical protein [Pyrinomonadaceae bacterium]
MSRRVAHTLTALACGLALAGCRWSYTSSSSGGIGSGAGDVGVGSAEGADAALKSLNTFTDELLAKVEKAGEAKAGVAEAQALLDARKGDLAGLVGALKRDPQSKARLLEAEVDNTDRVHRLQLKYADEAARDAELKAGLERLIADYDALFR